MTGLALRISVPLERFELSVSWETSVGSLGIFGHSGSGKTTILEAIAGLRRSARGSIRIGSRTWLDSAAGVCEPPERRGVGYVPQDGLLFPHRDVMGNLLAGRRRAVLAGDPRIDVGRVLRVLELDDLRHRDVSALSGGERQRVALGRALCSGPEILLLDEPLAGLDLPLRRRILPYLMRVREEFSTPTIYVSHDASEVAMLAEEVVVLERGRFVARGGPHEVFTRPEIFPIARVEGFENVASGKVVAVRDGLAQVEVEPGTVLAVPAEGLSAGKRVLVGLRAEDLILAVAPPGAMSAQNVLSGTIRALVETRPSEAGDGAVLVEVGLGRKPTPMTAAVSRQACRGLGLSPGLTVHLIAKAHALRVLAAW